MSESLVVREDVGPIAIVTLNRPQARNALSRAMVSELGDLVAAMSAEPPLRAMILAAEGSTFCAGMDLKESAEAASSSAAESLAVDDMKAIADLIGRLHQFPHPTIAAVQGPALAGGAGLVGACDFVLMASSASLGFPEVKRGLVAAIIMHDLVRVVGDRRARDLLLTGRTIQADEAATWGLINRVVPEGRSVRDEALALARSLLECAPIATTTTKRLLDDVSTRPVDLRGAAAISAAVRVGDEASEGMTAFLEKRRPAWDRDESTGH